MNGTACQTTSIQIDVYASPALLPQSVFVMSPKTCSWVSAQFTTP